MRIKYVPSKDPRAISYNEFISSKFPKFLTEKKPDILLVAGGDGAMHHLVYENSDFKGIFLGKAMGTLNFLMNKFADDETQLRQIISGELKLFTSTIETISIHKNGKYLGEVANDVIIGDSVNGYHTFQISTADRSFSDFQIKGTGICISTPLGSTAYNYNNGGPILPLESEMWSVTGIVCNRVLKDILQGQVMTIRTTGGNLFLSGIDSGILTSEDSVELSKGKKLFIGFLNETTFMQRRVEFSHRVRKESEVKF